MHTDVCSFLLKHIPIDRSCSRPTKIRWHQLQLVEKPRDRRLTASVVRWWPWEKDGMVVQVCGQGVRNGRGARTMLKQNVISSTIRVLRTPCPTIKGGGGHKDPAILLAAQQYLGFVLLTSICLVCLLSPRLSIHPCVCLFICLFVYLVIWLFLPLNCLLSCLTWLDLTWSYSTKKTITQPWGSWMNYLERVRRREGGP